MDAARRSALPAGGPALPSAARRPSSCECSSAESAPPSERAGAGSVCACRPCASARVLARSAPAAPACLLRTPTRRRFDVAFSSPAPDAPPARRVPADAPVAPPSTAERYCSRLALSAAPSAAGGVSSVPDILPAAPDAAAGHARARFAGPACASEAPARRGANGGVGGGGQRTVQSPAGTRFNVRARARRSGHRPRSCGEPWSRGAAQRSRHWANWANLNVPQARLTAESKCAFPFRVGRGKLAPFSKFD